MPNLHGGNSYKRSKKGSKTVVENILPLVDDYENCHYAQIVKSMGAMFSIILQGGKEDTAIIRGKMKNRIWCNPNDVVMVQYDLGKYIIIHKYSPDHTKQLKSLGHINFSSSDNATELIKFEDDSDDNDSDDDNNIFKKLNDMKKDVNKDNLNIDVDINIEEDPTIVTDEKISHKIDKKFKDKVNSGKIITEVKRSDARDKKNIDKWIDDI
jgi:initiation factor 1A